MTSTPWIRGFFRVLLGRATRFFGAGIRTLGCRRLFPRRRFSRRLEFRLERLRLFEGVRILVVVATDTATSASSAFRRFGRRRPFPGGGSRGGFHRLRGLRGRRFFIVRFDFSHRTLSYFSSPLGFRRGFFYRRFGGHDGQRFVLNLRLDFDVRLVALRFRDLL